jgi:hypothetical protein
MNPELPVSPVVAPHVEPKHAERRVSRREKLAHPVRVRPADPRLEEEVRASVNFSRAGIYFTTALQHYYIGMHVELAFPYREGEIVYRTTAGEVIRLERRAGAKWGVAVRLLLN